jgi:MYXO-CTERM domain-containing protein
MRRALGIVVGACLLGLPLAALAADGGGGCGSVGYVGCCIDATKSQYCSNGKLLQKTCTAPKKCGWNTLGANMVYTCGDTENSDPSGTYKKSCAAVLDAGAVPDPDWSIKKDQGTPKSDGKADAPPAVPCGAITSKGCCEDDNTSKFCLNNALKTKDCTKAPESPKCGWKTNGYYCGTNGEADPTGANPRLCSAIGKGDGSVTPPAGDTGGTTKDQGGTTKKDAGTTPKKTDDGGCSCALGAGPAAGGLLLLAAAVLVLSLARRRRR